MPINDTIFKRLEVANEEERERICKIFNLSPRIKNETISAVYREACLIYSEMYMIYPIQEF